MNQYFENNENLKSNIEIKKVKIKNKDFEFMTDNGVFSKKGLDFGTRSLLETINIEEITGNVLDFGCGYGPIGIYVASMTNANVHMIDINRRSLELARRNVNLNHVNVQIYESNLYENVTETFDYIISNPPIRVGKTILYELLFKAKEHLEKNGKLIIVVNKDQGAKSLMKDLEKEYKVCLLNKNKGFYIIEATYV